MSRSSVVLATVTLLAGCASTTTVVAPAPRARTNPSASVHVLGVPPGHLPRQGLCRVWVPGMPPGRQARARSCRGIIATAPAGSWILYRPSRDRSVVRVHYVDNVRTGVVVIVRFFNPADGSFLREGSADDFRDFGEDDDDDDRGRGRDDDRDRGRRRP
jgi:hypothetical protein